MKKHVVMSSVLFLWSLVSIVQAHDIRVGAEQDPNGWAECPVKSARHVPMHAWPGNDGRLVEIASDSGNFKTTVLTGEMNSIRSWKGERRKELYGIRSCFNSEIVRYSSTERSPEKWYSVEHVAVEDYGARGFDSKEGRLVYRAVGAMLCGMPTGELHLSVSRNAKVSVIRWGRMNRPDLELKRRFDVDFASIYHGTVKVDGLYYSLDVAFLAREHEIWRLEAAVEVDAKNDSDAVTLADANDTGHKAYGHFFWNFRPLKARSDGDTVVAHKIDRVEYPDLSSRLWRSVESNDVRALERLLAQGANPNYKNERNISLLGQAVTQYGYKTGNAKVIEVLLEHGADPNQRWGTGNSVTPFWSFAQGAHLHGESDEYKAGCIAIVRMMLRKGADPNAKYGARRVSALGIALVWSNDLDLVKALVEGGAEITDKMIENAKGDVKEYLAGVRNGMIKVVPITKEEHCASARSKLPAGARVQRAKAWNDRKKAIRMEMDPVKRKQMIDEDLQKFRERRNVRRRVDNNTEL